MKTIHILHLEDNPEDANLIQTMVKRLDLACHFIWVDTKEKFENSITNPELNIILSDYALPHYNGLAALQYAKEKRPGLPFILLSGTIGEERAIELFKAGAADFITKNNLQRLAPTIKRAVEEVEEKNKRELAEKKLKANEVLFRQFAENIKEVFWRFSPDGNDVIYTSPAYEEIWGLPISGLDENPLAWYESILPEDKLKLNDFFSMAKANIASLEFEFRIQRPDKTIRTILSRASLLKENGQGIVGIIAIAVDITLRAEFRDKLQSSLEEKEAMLKEIYHRVKNNLQVVSSLLYMQAKSIPDPTSRDLFLESSARVKSMALVHEMLYQSGNLACIEMHNYLQNLTKYLVEIYHVNISRIKLFIKSETVSLGIDEAIPCSLIVNELISNAYKHAFPDEKPGQIQVRIERIKKNILLQVSDNGIGFPSQVDFNNTSTLGIQLVHALTKQLGGDIQLDTAHGTTFTLVFPVTQGDVSDEIQGVVNEDGSEVHL